MRITNSLHPHRLVSAQAPAQGERGLALWRTQHFGELRVRMVRYSPGYLADHWCEGRGAVRGGQAAHRTR